MNPRECGTTGARAGRESEGRQPRRGPAQRRRDLRWPTGGSPSTTRLIYNRLTTLATAMRAGAGYESAPRRCCRGRIFKNRRPPQWRFLDSATRIGPPRAPGRRDKSGRTRSGHPQRWKCTWHASYALVHSLPCPPTPPIPPSSPMSVELLGVGIILALWDAFGIGANDVGALWVGVADGACARATAVTQRSTDALLPSQQGASTLGKHALPAPQPLPLRPPRHLTRHATPSLFPPLPHAPPPACSPAANSFATSVNSGVFSMTQVAFVAVVFEFLGAIVSALTIAAPSGCDATCGGGVDSATRRPDP
jgi:hypothetical protein